LPISIEDAKVALRIRHSLEDNVLRRKLRAAVEYIETRTNRLLSPCDLELVFGDWPECTSEPIELKVAPIRALESFEYRDTAGDWAEVDETAFSWRRTDEGGEVFLFSTFTAPDLHPEHRDRVRIRFSAGYEVGDETGAADEADLIIPDKAIEAVLLLAGHWFENREASTDVELAVVPLGVKMLVDQLRIYR